MPIIERSVVWLDGSRRPPGSPIRRRWRLRIAGRTVLLIPMTTVGWSRGPQHNHDAHGIYPNCPACGTDFDTREEA